MSASVEESPKPARIWLRPGDWATDPKWAEYGFDEYVRADLLTTANAEIARKDAQLRACQILSGDGIGDFPEGHPAFEHFADIHQAACRGLAAVQARPVNEGDAKSDLNPESQT
jgi:hypothetical protein